VCTWLVPQTDAEFDLQLAHVWQLDTIGRAAATAADAARAQSFSAVAPSAQASDIFDYVSIL